MNKIAHEEQGLGLQFRDDLRHGSVNVCLNVQVVVDSDMFVAVEEVAGLTLRRQVFLRQARGCSFSELKLEVLDFG